MMFNLGTATVIFLTGFALLIYVYCGYGLLLELLVRKKDTKDENALHFSNSTKPFVTILLCVHNEAANIKNRLDNLMDQEYPEELIEILVVSDGSTDATEEIVRSYKGKFPIQLLLCERLGKSGAQNMAVKEAKGEIVVLTDAEAVFDPAFVREIVKPFTNSSVGCATGNLGLINRSGVIAENQSRYWRYELKLRRLESQLGILAIASGQCMAFRKSLFIEIPPFVGDDCFIPLSIVQQGYRAVYCEKAKAYDVMESESEREYATRVRMTMRNWTGTWLFPALLNPFANLGYAFALWSHKLLRWLGGVILIIMALSSAAMLFEGGWKTFVALIFIAFIILGVFGMRNTKSGTKLHSISGTIYSFLLANTAFTVGVWRALTGKRMMAYKAGSLG